MYFLQNATSQISQSLSPLQDIVKALHDADRTNTYLVFATMGLAIATVVLAIIAIIQSNALRTHTKIVSKEFESTYRALIGASSRGFEGKDPLTIWFYYKNYGKTLGNNVKEKWNFSNTKPDKSSMEIDNTHVLEKSISLPTQERGFPLTVDKKTKDDSMNGITELYAWVLLDYDSADGKKGQYGVIGKLDPNDGTIQIIDEWAF